MTDVSPFIEEAGKQASLYDSLLRVIVIRLKRP